MAFVGERISLTFRSISTFLSVDDEDASRIWIWGQGATGKTRTEAQLATSGGEDAARLLNAFGEENRMSDFDWEKAYGEGFDVLHFSA